MCLFMKGAALSTLDSEWVATEFVPTVQKRGAAVIAARRVQLSSNCIGRDKIIYPSQSEA